MASFLQNLQGNQVFISCIPLCKVCKKIFLTYVNVLCSDSFFNG